MKSLPASSGKASDIPGVKHREIEAEFAGQRVDNYLLRELKGVPKSRIYRIVRKGEVRVNGKRVKPDTRLQTGDLLRIPPVRISEGTPSRNTYLENSIDKTILYESKVMLIINKPAGVAVHGGSGISAGVIEALRQVRPDEPHLELVHRLDRGTSGCLMIARKRSYLKLLQSELHRKAQLKKYYLVVTHGHWPARQHYVNAPLQKNLLASGERISRVQEDGKASITQFEVLDRGAQLSLLRAFPVTGRTHQIRVHCRYVGHPVVGDEKYGFAEEDRKQGAQRLMLHASRLEIPALGDYPAVSVDAPPDDQFLSMLGKVKTL